LVIVHVTRHSSRITRHTSFFPFAGAADLFLDNLWVNAHTTATETLWAGVPVLTSPNIPLASRVASSLLQAANLTELIARDADDYLNMALLFASRPHILRSLQTKLRLSRAALPLFDSRSYADEFERVIMLFAEAQAASGVEGRGGKAMHVAVTDASSRAQTAGSK
jgi:predicted O-linked N-acetylglucosamine transferase (SPINDLY family)